MIGRIVRCRSLQEVREQLNTCLALEVDEYRLRFLGALCEHVPRHLVLARPRTNGEEILRVVGGISSSPFCDAESVGVDAPFLSRDHKVANHDTWGVGVVGSVERIN